MNHNWKYMNYIVQSVLIIFMLSFAVQALSDQKPAGAAVSSYTIGAGDVLSIAVWKEDALTQDAVVRPDGKIVFPLIGELIVADKTPESVKIEVAAKLKPFVPDPILTVSVRQINSLIIYVVGKVNRPGQFVLNRDVNVLQALAMAGGLNSFANNGDIRVFRGGAEGTRVFPFDYDEVSKGDNLDQNIVLKRGDVIVVP